MALESFLAVVIGFVLGTIPFSYLVGRWVAGVDVRRMGNRNVGALNAYRQAGKLAGGGALLLDAGKGAAAVYISQRLGVSELTLAGSALAATLGHNFNPFLGFRGGKGAATVLGISLITLWQITLISMGAGIIVVAATRHSVLSMTAVFITLNTLTIVTGQSTVQISLCLILSGVIAGTHFLRQRSDIFPAIKARRWGRFITIE